MSKVENNWRNRTAVRLCNFILNNLATPTYRRALDGIIQRGMQDGGTKTGRMECSKPNLSCPPDKHPLDWVDEG